MNLAFPALCILLLALPGILFRKAFARAALPMPLMSGSSKHRVNKYPVSIRPFTEEISISLVWTILLHVLWLIIWSIPCLAQFMPNFDDAAVIVHGPGGLNSGYYADAIHRLVEKRVWIATYFMTLYAVSFLLGRFTLWIVRDFNLDHSWMMVRLDDQWFYFLNGEIFKFSEFKQFFQGPVPKISGTYVSVVVTQSDADYLYKGFLWDFHLDRDGGLDRLVLHHAIRTKFDPPTGNAEGGTTASVNPPLPTAGNLSPHEILEAAQINPGELRITDAGWKFQRVSSQLFTVRYADCKTLACTYFYVRKRKSSAPAQAPLKTS